MNETNNTPESPSKPSPKSQRTPWLPNKDEDLKNLAIRVSEKWKREKLFLKWKTQEDFSTITEDFAKELEIRANSGDSRKPISQQLSALDKEADKNIEYVKNYIKERYDIDNAKAYYPQFGIELLSSGAYKLSNDRDGRIRSLKKLIQTMTEQKMTTQRYGVNYWEDFLIKYEALVTQAYQTDSTISEKVKDKNLLRDEIRKTLTSLLKLLEAHNPDTTEAVWREWGFQRTKY